MMLILGLALLVVFAFAARSYIDADRYDREGVVAFSVLMVVLVGFAAYLLPAGINSWLGAKRIEMWESPIASLERDSEVSGSFFLGSGHVGAEPVYFFYRDTGQGLKLGSVSAWRAWIVEDGRCCLETRCSYVPWSWWWGSLIVKRYRYYFHVPKGTVVRQFKG